MTDTFVYWRDLGISKRSARCLAANDINSINELRRCSQYELLRLPDFGRKSLRELNQAFALGFVITGETTQIEKEKTTDNLGDDILRGVNAIAGFIGENKYRTYRLCAARMIPVGKQGTIYVASRKALRAHYERLTSGKAPDDSLLTNANITPIRRSTVGQPRGA